MNNQEKKILYCDLDGTIRKGFEELGKFVNSEEDVEIFEGVKEKLLAYKKAGWRIVGITNQGGVATGNVLFADMKKAMMKTQTLVGDSFDKIYACTHHPDAKKKEDAICWCRKPMIGNIVLAAHDLGQTYYDEFYPPYLSLFIGDRPEDEQCAKNANIPFMEAKVWRETPIETLLSND